MRPRDKKKSKHDARFRPKPERVWTAARVPLAHPIDVGDDFDRPDALLWLDEAGTLAARVVAQDAPDDAIVALYAEALARAGGAPTLVRAVERELADVLTDRLPHRPPVVVAPDALRGREVRVPADVAPQDTRPRHERAMLEGAKVSAAELGLALGELMQLCKLVPWAALPPWSLEFILRAPGRGVPDASLLLQHNKIISVARSVAARDDTLTWPRRGRPRGSFFLDAVFTVAAHVPVLAKEAATHGWRRADATSPVAWLCASDVEDIPRPLVRSDLDLMRLAAAALSAWYAQERRLNFWRPSPLAIDVAPGVTLEVRTTRIVALRADDEDDWLDRWGPHPPDSGRVSLRHGALLAALRDAGDLVPSNIEARVIAAGSDVVPALCDELAETLEPGSGGSEWHAPWLLLALGRIGDVRALPYVTMAGVLHRRELGDFFTESLPAVFAGFGPLAIPQLTELLASPCLDPYLRVAAGTALFAIGVDHPEARPTVRHVFTSLYDWFDEATDPDGTVATLLATRAVRTGDAALYEAVAAAVEGGRVDPLHLTRDDLDRVRAEASWTRDGQADLVPVADLLRRPSWCL